MPFPENTPLPIPEPDFAGFPTGYDPTGYDPAVVAAPVATNAPGRLARAQFRRFERPEPSPGRTAALHLGLFLVTLVTTTLAGIQLTRGAVDFLPLGVFQLRGAALWVELRRGLWFALPFLGVLTVH